MSCWCHVAAVMRIDALRIDDYKEPDWDELIGKECIWNISDDETWDDVELNPEKYLPMGSEGSLQKIVWTNPKPYCMNAYTVSIFGDLRDRDDDDADKIIEWFKNKCNQFAIRQASITVDTGGYGIKTYIYKEDDKDERKST